MTIHLYFRVVKKAELLTTCFGLGKLPVAPGTWGSLPPVVAYMVLGYLYPDPAANANVYAMVFFIVAGSWACIRYAPAVIAVTGKKDPGLIVADEVAGQAITMLIIALLAPNHTCIAAGLGVVLFRLFDILKPWPCKRLEKFHAGIGILADDLMAGVYAGAVYVMGYYTFIG